MLISRNRRSIVVISPHLDDAAFSLGAYIRQQSRAGVRVETVTVLTNDPESGAVAGAWDARCGFSSAAVAARARREEDLRACSLLDATPLWLPYGDETYGRGASDEQIWDDLAPSLRRADAVLLPGYPLALPDHRFVTRLVLERRHEFSARLGCYVEQPYAAGRLLGDAGTGTLPVSPLRAVRNATRFAVGLLHRETPMPPSIEVEGLAVGPLRWDHLATSRQDRRAKRRAVMSYRSQLPPLGAAPMLGAWVYEVVQGGEALAWL